MSRNKNDNKKSFNGLESCLGASHKTKRNDEIEKSMWKFLEIFFKIKIQKQIFRFFFSQTLVCGFVVARKVKYKHSVEKKKYDQKNNTSGKNNRTKKKNNKTLNHEVEGEAERANKRKIKTGFVFLSLFRAICLLFRFGSLFFRRYYYFHVLLLPVTFT